ncbi:LysR family transcriptional regulator [Microbulbifer sp. S227A]|uniref:LysR family transcriptional regulator n=1 Tax=Microbulbifer sp. S227A TaxID=3415131 RepID=UPI003C7E72F0
MDLLRSFTVFQNVAEQGSFSAAANVLGIVPSAVSRQIGELEEWAGLRLINRTTRSLHLTEEGQAYLSKLRHITAEIEALKTLGDTDQRLTGHVRLTTPMMLGQFVLPSTLARFKQDHPGTEISVSVVNRRVDLVEEGFDLAVRAGRLSDSTLVARKAGHVRMCTVASPAYLAARGEPAAPADLTSHNCLSMDATAHFVRWPFQVDGAEMDFKVSGDMRANDSHCLKALALAGLGIARLPRINVAAEIAAGSLIEILHGYARAPLPVHILYQSGRHLSPTLRAFIDFAAQDLRHALRTER